MHSLQRLVQGERGRFGAALAALSLGVALSFVPALVTGAAIDGISGGAPEGGVFSSVSACWRGLADPQAGRLSHAAAAIALHAGLSGAFLLDLLAGTLWRAVAAIVLFTAGSGVFLYLQGRWAAQAAENLALRLRERLYDHLQRLPASYHDRADAGDLVQRCSSDVETVRTFLATQVVVIGRSVLLVALALPFMLALNSRMTLWSLLLFPPILVLAVVFFGRVRSKFLEVDEAEGQMTSVLQENLSGIRVVRAFAQQEHEIARFGEANRRFRDLSEELLALLARYWSASDLLCMGQVGIVLIAGGALIRSGELTAGALFTFMGWVNLLVWPVRHAGRVLTESGKATVSLGRIQEVLEEPEEIEHERTRPELSAESEPRKGELVLERLTFAHGEGLPVLHEVSFRAAPGETVALVGPPGCGKSTLLDLLLRVHEPDAGAIRVDGRDLRELRLRESRRLFAAVLQEPFLFSRSVADNIRLAAPQAGREDVEEAARAACVHDSVERFSEGYETVVGERGVTLSGGQRQRVALARALLEDAPILLLDDALSAVDTETEAAIVRALAERHGRRTTVVAAHRLSTVREADLIVVLDRGRVVQSGRHEELLRQEGPYRRTWAIQAEQIEALSKDLGAVRANEAGGAA